MTIDEAIELAAQHVNSCRQADAKLLYEAVLEQFPNSQPAQQGLDDLEIITKRENDGLSEVLNLLNAQKYEQAFERATDLTNKHLQSATAFELLGRATAYMKRNNDAVAALKNSILLDDNNPIVHTLLADILLGCSQFEKAIAHYHRSLEIDPNNLNTLNNLGVTYSTIGRFQKAIKCHEAVLKINPNSASAHNNLAVVYHDSGDYKNCIKHCRKAIEINPGHDSALNNLGNAQMGLSQFNEAAESYKKALKITPQGFDIRSKLMLCLTRVCNWDALDIEKENVLKQFQNSPSGSAAPNPWAWLGIFDDPELHKKISIATAKKHLTSRPDLGPIAQPKLSGKILIGYFSADFHDHPTTNLLVNPNYG